MTPEETKIARAFVKCSAWKWMPGMLTLEEVVPPAVTLGWDAARVLHADEDEPVRVCTALGRVRDIHATALPDLNDPGTLGCVRHIVVGVWGIVDWDLAQVGRTNWYFGFVTLGGEDFDFWGSTEVEALLRALQAAPEAP